MPEKPTYEELEQRIHELESKAADLQFTTTIPIEGDQIFKHCFENANVGVCLVEPEGDFIKVDNRMVEIFGYSKQEFEGMNVADVSHPEDIAISLDVQRRVKVGKIESTVFQKRYIHKKGHMFWGQVSNSIVKDREGRPLYFVTHFMDITESKMNEEELLKIQNALESLVDERTAELSKANLSLRNSEERLHTVIDQSPFPVAFADTNDEKIIYWSQSAIKMFGHDPKTVSEWYELAYPDPVYRKQVLNHWKPFKKKASKSKKAINTGEYDICCKNGTVKICEIYAQFIPGNLVITLNDITERKQAEEILRINDQRYKSAQRMGNVGNWEYDLTNKTFWGSDQAKRIYGFDIEADEFTTDEVENCIPERERVHQALIDLIERDIPYNLEFDIYPVSVPETRTIRSVAEIIRDTSGAPLKVIGVIQDITDQKKSIQEKEKLERKLIQAQKMESIGTLAGGIAHDFNNILSSIIGFTELSLDEVKKDSNLEDNLQEVYSAGKRAKELVNHILAFARQSDKKRSPIQPGMLAKEALQFIRSTIPTSIEIRENIQSESLIMANATQVHQVLMNLCTNAAQTMEESGGVLSVSLKDVDIDKEKLSIGMKSGDYIEIKVSDTGSGIAPEIIESIFEPYFTTKGPGEGTGMGLAMVQGVVETYGGKITVNSQVGKGSTFTIYLPITKERSDHDAYVSEQLPLGTEHILFIDDEVPIANMGCQILERLGYSVTTRSSSVEALEIFKAKPNDFDLVVTDMTMPNLTGDKLAIELMKIRPDIPIILCTGYSKKISNETASEIGIKAFAYKPMVKAELAKTIRKILDETKSENQG
jgi:PAS domain S-box-containing protein